MHSTAAAIYKAYEDAQGDGLRAHLGGSEIGGECERACWYAFRWVATNRFDGRLLRLFETGKREEARVHSNLRKIGCRVTGLRKQITVSAVGGHAGGSLDGIVKRLPEAPKTPHLLEVKTHGAKSFADLAKKGVRESKPAHYAQMQWYCGLSGLTRWLYFAVNKDSDELHIERGEFDKEAFATLMIRAIRVVEAAEPPAKLSDDPEFYVCKMCRFRGVCHGQAVPLVNCRTCLHSTADASDGNWKCARWNHIRMPEQPQKIGCPEHRYIPALLANIGEAVDADEAANTVTYRRKDGSEFVNDRAGLGTAVVVDEGRGHRLPGPL